MTAPAASAPVLAPDGPTTPAAVLAWVKVKDTAAQADDVADVVAAVNALVREDGVGWLPVPADGAPWSPAHSMGTKLLASRIWRRRNSPGGVEPMGSDGAAAYVQRNDPDVALFLGLGANAKPSVG